MKPEEQVYEEGCRVIRGVVNAVAIMALVFFVGLLIWCNTGCVQPTIDVEPYPYNGPIVGTNGIPLNPK